MYDLQTWMGAPSLYVYDCSNAGVVADNFRIFADQHDREYEVSEPVYAGGQLWRPEFLCRLKASVVSLRIF